MKPPPRRFAKPWRGPLRLQRSFQPGAGLRFLARDEDGIAEYRRTLEFEARPVRSRAQLRHAAVRRKDAGAQAFSKRPPHRSSANSGRATTWRKPRRSRRFRSRRSQLPQGHRAGSEVRRRRIRPGPVAGAARQAGDATPHYRQAASLDPSTGAGCWSWPAHSKKRISPPRRPPSIAISPTIPRRRRPRPVAARW